MSTAYTKDLIDILLLDIPSIKPSEIGFLEIAGIQYKEVIISRLYAHFLDRERNAEIADLFMESLLNLIAEKTQKIFTLSNYRCNTEVVTKKGNRIDLLLESIADKEAIIIENKVFNQRGNDLLDYWETPAAISKIGILLTLYPAIPGKDLEGRFINITHTEWMKAIQDRGVPLNLALRDYIYLNDFIKNLLNMTTNNGMSIDARFFFEHTERVLRATETKNAAYNFVEGQVKLLAEKLNWSCYGNSPVWRHIWDKKNDAQIYYAIVFDKVTSPNPEVTIFLEVCKDALKRETEFRQLLTRHGFYNHLQDDRATNTAYAHLAYKTYTLRLKDIEQLADYILKKIEEDFNEAFTLLTAQMQWL